MSEAPSIEAATHQLTELFRQLRSAQQARTTDCPPVDDPAIDHLWHEIHHLTAHGDSHGELEKEKLRQKDQNLVDLTASLARLLRQANWMPLGTVRAFVLVLTALQTIEQILWELKGEKGDPPKPGPDGIEPL